MNAVNPLSSETFQEFENTESIAQQNLIGFEPNAESNNEVKFDLELDSAPDLESETQIDLPSLASHDRYLITRIEQQQLAFPLSWVAELILVEQSRILALPFYNPMVFGVFHDKGHGVPLIIAPLTNEAEITNAAQRFRTKRTLTAVRLNQAVGKLAGVGVIVDQVIERFASVSQADLQSHVRVFQIEDIPESIWQPRSMY